MKASEKPLGRRVLEFIDQSIDNMVLVIFIMLLLFGVYSLADAHMVYQSADASNYVAYRPTEDDSPSFKELQKINKEVFGWLTIIDTDVDYPIARADDNEKYVDTNAMGEYSLVGSLFLDYRNQIDFSDYNNIIYGHHMEQSKMFGCFDEFKDQQFFREHPHANIYFDGRKHGVELFAFILADAYDYELYHIIGKDETAAKKEYLSYVKSKALRKLPVKVGSKDTLIVLSTCTEDITNGRFLLVGKLVDTPFPEPDRTIRNLGLGLGNRTGFWALLPVWKWAILFVILILLLLYLFSLWRDVRAYQLDHMADQDSSHRNE